MAKLALCVGINDYPGNANDLSGCINDARDWGVALQSRGFNVTKLLNKDASGKNMRAAIQAVLAQANSGDVVVFQYSGHGSYVPDENGEESDGRDECLCPHDINSKGPLTDDELFRIYSNRKPGVRLIILSDSCHSGTVAKFAPITTPAAVKGRSLVRRRVKFLPPSTFLSKRQISKLGIARGLRRSSPPGRHAGLLIAGCQDAEYSYDAYFANRPNGAFTYVALRALDKLSKNATYGDWFGAIRKALPSQQYPQTPNLYGASTMKKWKVFA